MKLTNRSKVVSDKKMTFGGKYLHSCNFEGNENYHESCRENVFGKGLATISYPESTTKSENLAR